jgi:hypothetical protein
VGGGGIVIDVLKILPRKRRDGKRLAEKEREREVLSGLTMGKKEARSWDVLIPKAKRYYIQYGAALYV